MFFDTYSNELRHTLDAINRSDIEKLEAYLEEARENGKRVFVLGNAAARRQLPTGFAISAKVSMWAILSA